MKPFLKFNLHERVEKKAEIGTIINMTLGGKLVKVDLGGGREEWIDTDKLRSIGE